MSVPTIGEQRFQAQLLDALTEIAGAIRENTGAVRELTGVLQATARETCKDGTPQPKRERHLRWDPGVQPPPEDQEDGHLLTPGPKVRM